MKSDKEIFEEFCGSNAELPLFLTSEWLNIVAKEKWDVALEIRGGKVVGFIPYHLSKKGFFTTIQMPPLTPYLGPWIGYPPNQKYSSKISFEKEVLSSLIQKLPKIDSFLQKFYPYITNWLPFYWKGFKQTTRYTYVIDGLDDLKQIFQDFQENIRREIRKAEKSLFVEESMEIEELFLFKKRSYESKDQRLVVNSDLFYSVFKYCTEKGCGKLYTASDASGQKHAYVFLVWDQTTVYYLFGASNPDFKNSGAMSLLMWEAIKFSSSQGKTNYNFEGSMIETIERFFRGFGAKQIPYFEVTKTNSLFFKLLTL